LARHDTTQALARCSAPLEIVDQQLLPPRTEVVVHVEAKNEVYTLLRAR
jgi:hypothetical protein